MAPNPAAGAPGLDQLLSAKEIVVSCGPGGVGKTTIAAAAGAMAAVHLGGRVLVLTVDPARRLASALGLAGPDGIGNVEMKVPDEAFDQAGISPRGQLWAAQLDTKQSWDALVRRHAPDLETAARILANPLYRNVAGRFVHSHEYIAMERLYEIHRQGDYDLIVVDTPPSRHALDLLEAPGKMAEFFSSRLLRLLVAPYRSRLMNLATRPFYQVADRILGSQFLEEIAEFFSLFQSMYEGFVERADAVTRLLHDRRTAFMAVTTLEPTPLRETEKLASALADRGYHLGALVLNRALPTYLRDPAAVAVAERLAARSKEVAEQLAPGVGQTKEVQRVIAEVAESFLNFNLVAQREAEQQGELEVTAGVVSMAPHFATDIHDLCGLLRLGATLWGAPRLRGAPPD
ncbi:MAG: ArsA family ATPase [Acidimicrobiales bacterium]|nr:ArsA family ATPase [Acidimicrobiales bacterium]